MEDLAAELYVALVRVVRSLRRDVPSDALTAGGLSALWALSRCGALRATALADIEGVAPASMTRIVHGLEEHGLVRRTPDPTDGRAQLLALTEAGELMVREGTEAKIDVVRRRVGALPEEDRAALQAALSALAKLSAQ